MGIGIRIRIHTQIETSIQIAIWDIHRDGGSDRDSGSGRGTPLDFHTLAVPIQTQARVLSSMADPARSRVMWATATPSPTPQTPYSPTPQPPYIPTPPTMHCTLSPLSSFSQQEENGG